MNQPEPPSASGETHPRQHHGGKTGRMARLALKELRETLRDRRTVVTLVVMPLIVYPLLSVAFQKFLLSGVPASGDQVFRIAVESEQSGETLLKFLDYGQTLFKEQQQDAQPAERANANGDAMNDSVAEAEPPAAANPKINLVVEDDLQLAVAELDVDLGVRLTDARPVTDESEFESIIHCELLYVAGSANGEAAAEMVETRLRAVNMMYIEKTLEPLADSDQVLPTDSIRVPVRGTGSPASYSLSALVPLILILMTITGAVYPAIDLTAGERERGTLEMLVAAPVPRMGLLLAKYVTVLLVALLTATINLVAMTVTILVIGLGPLLFGEDGLSVAIVAQVFGLMILFAAFFSAVLLAVTSFARSFKEAQAYLIPIMLVSIAPGLVSMIPGIELGGLLAVTPLINIVLLARDLFEHTAEPITAGVVVVSTALFALAAITVAGRVFGTDAILYGSPGTWSDLLRRPKRVQLAPTLTSAMLLLALMFPAYFVMGNLLARLQGASLGGRLSTMSLITIALFAAMPLAAALYNRLSLTSTFQLKPAHPLAFVAAVLLGVSLWPFAYELVLWTSELGLATLGEEHVERIDAMIAQFRTISPVWIVLTLAIVPAVFEEFFFRGYLLSALRPRTSPAGAIVVSGVLFGLFHLLVTDQLAVERFLPSTLLGFVLAWVCIQSGSVAPGMLMHACHNALLLLVSYYAEDLEAAGWGTGEELHLPLWGLALAAVGAVAGLGLVRLSRGDGKNVGPAVPAEN